MAERQHAPPAVRAEKMLKTMASTMGKMLSMITGKQRLRLLMPLQTGELCAIVFIVSIRKLVGLLTRERMM